MERWSNAGEPKRKKRLREEKMKLADRERCQWRRNRWDEASTVCEGNSGAEFVVGGGRKSTLGEDEVDRWLEMSVEEEPMKRCKDGI